MANEGKYGAVVIGGGIGGLCCAIDLLSRGIATCVVEQGANVGGAFTSFRRGKTLFDTGFHWVGGAGPGEMMYPLLCRYGLDKLPWKRLDDEGFNEIHTGEDDFAIPTGTAHFQQRLSEAFPDERKAIGNLVATLDHLASHLYDSLDPAWNIMENPLFSTSALEYLEREFHSSRLRRLICGCAANTELTARLPLYSLLQSMASFLQGAYRLQGGGQLIADTLAERILQLGGDIKTSVMVNGIMLDGDTVSGVTTNDGELHADLVISTIHPSLTIGLLPESKCIRGIYRRRMAHLPNTRGYFTVQLQIKPDTLPYLDRSLSIIGSDPFGAGFGANGPKDQLFVNYAYPEDGSLFAQNIDLLVPMEWSAVSQWSESRHGHRPKDYHTFKQQQAEECITLAARYIDGLADAVQNVYTSTPLTYRDYTGTIEGSAFGVQKHNDNLAGTILSPATPVRGLYLAGQSVTLHGMLGTMMSSARLSEMIQV